MDVLAARSKGRTLGVAVLAYRPNIAAGALFASIEDLYVSPEARSQGMGQALLAAADERCRARKISYVEVQVEDEEAESFYKTLGYEPEGNTRIEFVDDLGDFKTAWDLVSFAGFLGVRMRMEFSWHGCDSALAAPLVLDLARLTAAAHRAGRHGPLTELAFFFKDPIGDVPHGLSEQWDLLRGFVAGLA